VLAGRNTELASASLSVIVARSNSGVVGAREKTRVAFRGVSSLVATCEALLVDHLTPRVKKLDFAD
jgi:hypothetical protein